MKIINTKHLILYLVLASCITPLVRSMDTGDFLKWVVENDNELGFIPAQDTLNADSSFSETIPPLGNVNPPSLGSLVAIIPDYPALPAQVNNPDINKGAKKRKRSNHENELPHDNQIDSPAPKRRKTGAEQLVAVTALTFQSQQDNEPTAMDIQQEQCLVPDCTETCIDKTELTKHLLTHAVKISTSPAQYQCPLCDTKPKAKVDLKRHIRTHTGEKPHKCNHPGCNYASIQKSDLKEHKLIHTGERPHECDYHRCTYAAKRKVHLNIHKLTHTGEKPHKCDHPECNYASKQKSNLNTHKLIHSGEKQHKCDYHRCTYASIRKGDLKEHKLIHSGEKPHKCDYHRCTYAAKRKVHLNIHKLTHTGERPYKCDHDGCEYAASRKSTLNRHKQTCKFRT